MGIEERRGLKQNKREQRGRIPDLGYYIIITDTKKTEISYFEELKKTIPDDKKDRLQLVSKNLIPIKELVTEALKSRIEDPQYRTPWIVFDRDKVDDFDQIICEAENNHIGVAWSNPCIEIWFFSYFGSIPNIFDSVSCCKEFGKLFKQKTHNKYDKGDPNIYHKLNKYGDQSKAIEQSKNKLQELKRIGKVVPSEMFPGNTVYKLIEEIVDKF